jgi:hypothetical protein
MLKFWARKDKHKKKAEPNIEFVSPYPLEDCVWQLENFPGVNRWFPIRTRINLSQVNKETWKFRVYRTYFDTESFLPNERPFLCYFKIEASGKLQRKASNTTLVVGQVYVSRSTVIFNLIFILTAVPIGIHFFRNLDANPSNILPIALLISVPISSVFSFVNKDRSFRTLRSQIKQAVGP